MHWIQSVLRRKRRFIRYALWSCVAAIIVLSLVPGNARPHTGAPGKIAHFIAYLGTGLFIAAHYRAPRRWQRVFQWARDAGVKVGRRRRPMT